MAKGFGKGFVTGVAGTVAAVAGAVYTFKKKSNRTRRTKKQLHRRKPQKSSTSPCLTLIIQKAPGNRSFFLLKQKSILENFLLLVGFDTIC